MKQFLPLSYALILLSVSCSPYQFLTLQSPDLSLNEKQELVIENDTLLFQYNFNGEGAPVNLKLENKLNKPLYVDWDRSCMIVDGKAIPFMHAGMLIDGGIRTTVDPRPVDSLTSYGRFNATATLRSQKEFLPPGVYTTKTIRQLFTKPVVLPESSYENTIMKMRDGVTKKMKRAYFYESQSPLKFASYLSVIIGEEGAAPVVYQHSFYVSEIIIAGSIPFDHQYGNYWYLYYDIVTPAY